MSHPEEDESIPYSDRLDSDIIELKLASGMTNPGRIRDLSDIVDLIVATNLPRKLSKRLHPYVCEKFLELYDGAQAGKDLGPHL